MRPLPRIAGLAALAAAVLAAPAAAQTAPERMIVLNEQLTFGDVVAGIRVVSATPTQTGLAAAASAAGAAMTASRTGGSVTATSMQMMTGATRAASAIDGSDACCAASTTAVAHGAAATIAAVDGGIDATMEQAVSGAASATAGATIGNTSLLSGVAGATGATLSTASKGGDVRVNAVQASSGAVSARTDLDACCTGLTSAAAAATGASATLASREGSLDARLSQTAAGSTIEASTDVFQMRGYDVAAASQAAANTATVEASFGAAVLNAAQDNSAYVRGETTVTLRNWDGAALVSGVGAGNQILFTNVGADAVADIAQANSGGIDAAASFTGGGGLETGGSASVSAAAVGNSYTGWACSQCGDALAGGRVTQTNSGGVTAGASVEVRQTTGASGAAAAVGNSATWITARGG